MEISEIRYRLLILVLLGVSAVGLLLVLYVPMLSSAPVAAGVLTVSFLDVGQGDAIFITTPTGRQVLIDGGSSAAVLSELSQQLSFFDRTLDVVIATHPDLDHIGGLVDVLERYDITTIVVSGAEGASAAADQFDVLVPHEQAMVVSAQAGQVLTLDASTTLTILSPTGDTSAYESNSASVVALLQHGDIGFMLSGDAPQGIEEYLVSIHGDHLEAEVLKLGHHGSKTSTSEAWLRAIDPLYAVVSAGHDNRYEHPHTSVVERVNAFGIPLLSTIEYGTITFVSNGQTVWVE